MNREKRTLMARETVAICDTGYYISSSGKRVSVEKELVRAKDGTLLYSAENSPKPAVTLDGISTTLEVRNETTFTALQRLSKLDDGHLGCLNFASAKNPGGGFLNGSLAQEEALAMASGLYPCLLRAPDYYSRNRANRSTLYLDLLIFSPLVPFFRDDSGALLEQPILGSVITAPAPNAGAIARNEPHNLPKVEPTLRQRAELVLAVAAEQKIELLILGAWGCGVFRNDPVRVAAIFAELLKPEGKFGNVFKHVAFAVFDRSESQATYQAFADRFGKRVP